VHTSRYQCLVEVRRISHNDRPYAHRTRELCLCVIALLAAIASSCGSSGSSGSLEDHVQSSCVHENIPNLKRNLTDGASCDDVLASDCIDDCAIGRCQARQCSADGDCATYGGRGQPYLTQFEDGRTVRNGCGGDCTPIACKPVRSACRWSTPAQSPGPLRNHDGDRNGPLRRAQVPTRAAWPMQPMPGEAASHDRRAGPR
jgi:hypothetical protein